MNISLPHTSYFHIDEPYKGHLTVQMMSDIAYGFAMKNMAEGDVHFLTFPEKKDTYDYISGILIHRNEWGCDLDWLGSAATSLLLKGQRA